MKNLLLFIVLLTFAFCDAPPRGKLIAVEDAFLSVKKQILLCISNSETASGELKKYATDFLATDLKENLNLHKFRENPTDRDVIRKCRREAFIHDTIRKPIQKDLKVKRFLAK